MKQSNKTLGCLTLCLTSPQYDFWHYFQVHLSNEQLSFSFGCLIAPKQSPQTKAYTLCKDKEEAEDKMHTNGLALS